MATPERIGSKPTNSTTPKLGRGIEPVDTSFESSALHQSGSKIVQHRVVGLNEQIVKRKTELAELLRSAHKKRVKKNEPGGDIPFQGLEQGFPVMANGADATDSSDGQVLFSGLKGSLLNDSTSYMQSPVTSVEASEGFSSSGLVDANNFFTNSEGYPNRDEEELYMEQEQLEEVDASFAGREGEAALFEEDDEGGRPEEQYAAEEEPLVLDQSSLSAFDTVLEYVGDAPMSSQTPRWPDGGGGGGGADGFEGNRVAKTLVFPDMHAPTSAPHAAAAARVAGAATAAAVLTPIVSRGLFLTDPSVPATALQSAFLQGAAEQHQVQRRTSPLASSSAEHKENTGSSSSSSSSNGGGGDDRAYRLAAAEMESPLDEGGRDLDHHLNLGRSGGSNSSSHPGHSNQHLINLSNTSFNASFSSSFTPSALGYRDSLLHQLKVTTAKNEMLQGKLRDIEELVDRNYGSISERSKLLTTERNKLEKQRTLLDDELVATKEELLFIRAQLQNKSARISELETELLEAQRRLIEPENFDGESDVEADEVGGQQAGATSSGTGTGSGGGSGNGTPAGAARRRSLGSAVSPEASATSMLLARSPAEVMAAEEESAREIELLGGLLVEQEQQLAEAEANRLKLEQLQEQYQTTLDENFLLASYVDNAERKSEELAGRVAELEEQVKAAEGLAFEFEARAAALELEVFRKMDEENAQAMREAQAASEALANSPEPVAAKHSVTMEAIEITPSHQQQQQQQQQQQHKESSQSPRNGDVNVLPAHSFSSSPSLPLLLHPSAPARVPREGYAVLLIAVAVLQATVWALLLLAGLLYLGILELRFGIDIVRDGGLHEPLFLLKGVAAIAHSAAEQIPEIDLSAVGDQLVGGAQYCTAVSLTLWERVATSATHLFHEALQLIQ